MRLARVALAALLSAACASSVSAQSAPAGQTRTIDSTDSTTLSAEKQGQVREALRQFESMGQGELKLPRVEGALTVGASVPAGIEPVALPQDRVTDVPQVTSYRFVVARNGIAVVDPETRQVVQIIPGL